MKRLVTTLCLALTLLVGLPAVARAYDVRDNSGATVGTVRRGDNDFGTKVGLITAASASGPRANVLRMKQDAFDGWTLIRGTSDEIWIAGILRRSSTRFTGGRVDGTHPSIRATKASNGRYWILSRRTHGSWRRIGSVHGSDCSGAWAAGAGRSLLW
jgi:hypothetical protein